VVVFLAFFPFFPPEALPKPAMHTFDETYARANVGGEGRTTNAELKIGRSSIVARRATTVKQTEVFILTRVFDPLLSAREAELHTGVVG